MSAFEVVCVWTSELVPLIATMIAFFYGVHNFFRKGKPLYLQSITMAMGCHALGNIYHLCQTLTMETLLEGFTPSYLGKIGFFLFFIVASYGQMDKIIDDGSAAMRPGRIIALMAPLLALLLYIPNFTIDISHMSTKITYMITWIPAMISIYFNFKHAILPDMDFGFVKAIRPYNILATCLVFSELICLTAWNYYCVELMAVFSIIFGVLCITTVMTAKKGCEKWTI